MKRISTTTFFSAWLATSCATSDSPQVTAVPTTVCQINLDQNAYSGKSIRITGVFKTDGRHYTYVADQHCSEARNAIDIGRGFGKPSYDELNRKWKKQCDARGERGLCVVEAIVDIVGALRHSEDGLVLDVEQISEVRSIKGGDK